MSITEEIQRIANNLSNAYTTVSNKGGTLPQNRNITNLVSAINSISGEGGSSITIPNCKLTINSGKLNIDGLKVSNFTYERYLTINNPFPISGYNTFEMHFCAKLDSLPSRNACIWFSSNTKHCIDIELLTDGKVELNIGDGNDWVYSGTSVNSIELNTFYYYKVVFDGSKYTFNISTDDENYEELAVIDSNMFIGENSTPFYLQFGVNRAVDYDWSATNNCTIDFSKCYIKIDNELWWDGVLTNNNYIGYNNIRNTLGYNIDLNPPSATVYDLNAIVEDEGNNLTITDNTKVSGFVLNNSYIKTPSNVGFSFASWQYSNWSVMVKFKFNVNKGVENSTILCNSDNIPCMILRYVMDNGNRKVAFWMGGSDYGWGYSNNRKTNYNFNLNTWYWLKIVSNGSSEAYYKDWSIQISTDGVDFITDQSWHQYRADVLNTEGFTFGSNPDSRWHEGSGVFTEGEIDFRGCRVEHDGELVWAGAYPVS